MLAVTLTFFQIFSLKVEGLEKVENPEEGQAFVFASLSPLAA